MNYPFILAPDCAPNAAYSNDQRLARTPRGEGTLRRSRLAITITLAVLFLAIHSSSASVTTVTTSSGLTLSVDSTGPYQISGGSPAWVFGGNLATTLSSITSTTGSDSNGNYHQITFNYTLSVARTSSIRGYDGKMAVLFTTTYVGAGSNANPFPRLSTYPSGLSHVSYGDKFGVYNFSTLYGDSPWIYFDSSARTFILSPAKNFMIAGASKGSDGSLSMGIDSAITSLPAGFSHKSWLVFGQGINSTYDVWGNCMTNFTGKTRVANDASTMLNKLGYWTDNGAAYYYNYDSTLGYEGTLLAIRDEFKQKGIPLGYMQLDSWWYPKGSSQDWTANGSGLYQYVAAPALFPDGLPHFQTNLGLPLVTHNRWIDGSSPYRSQYTMSKNVSTAAAFWNNIIGYIHTANVMTYEQDWLNDLALPNMNLNDPPNFMNNMAAACSSNGIEMQYCMPLARHYLQGSLYNNLRTMRVSDDSFSTGKWDSFLYDSKLVTSLGAWAWTDVVDSNRDNSLMLQALSAGPVGVGNALGTVNVANVQLCVRADGVIVKPDAPITPIDETYLGEAQSGSSPMVAAAWTDFSGLRDLYLVGYARDATHNIASFKPSALGVSGSAYVYNWNWLGGSILKSGETFNAPIDIPNSGPSSTLFLAAPVGSSGIAFLGDPGKFASLGKKRISQLSDNGTVSATVLFATGETSVNVWGWSPTQPQITASNGTVGSIAYDATTGLFSAPISPGANATAQLSVSRVAGTQTTLRNEAEILSIVQSSAAVSNGGNDGLSNDAASHLASTVVGDLVSYNVNVPEARTYDVRVGVRKTSASGTFQMAVAAAGSSSFVNHGAVQDSYNATNLRAEFDLGTVTFGSAGDKTFRFTVTGKNAASSGYELWFDYITLIAQ